MKTKLCPMCDSEAFVRLEKYESGKVSAVSGAPIIVPDVKISFCSNKNCNHSWLPAEEEERIDLIVERQSRFHLSQDEIAKCRKAFGFNTKTAAANFLCLNTKAFVKWENGTNDPNLAYDLLIRLAVFDRRNFAFIKYLHETNFKFDPLDYQLICETEATKWKFKALVMTHPKLPIGRKVEDDNSFESIATNMKQFMLNYQELNATILFSGNNYRKKESVDLSGYQRSSKPVGNIYEYGKAG